MTMSESSLEAELLRAQDEARQARAELQESIRRVSELEESATSVQIRALEEQIEELRAKVAFPGSPKSQSEDEYIVVEPELAESLSFQLKEREAEIRKAIAHAKKLEEMYNAAEERTRTFERQVQVLEGSLFEKFDDANALLEKVKELDELLTAGQIQINALEEKSKTSDEAQKKVEYEKVLFLETEDQLVKNFRKAHDEAEQYRSMINQLEASVRNAEEKAAHAEKCMEVASQRNQELESEIADLSLQLQQRTRPMEPKVELLEQELQLYRDQKKVDDDVRSVDEKTVVHEATTTSLTHPVSASFEDEMKFLGENAMAHVTQSKLLMSQIEKLRSDAFEAESRAQVLEGKVRELEEEIVVSRQREERLKLDAKVMEENVSLFEGLKLSYADYTADLLKKNSKLEEELVIMREEVDRMRGAEALVVDLRAQIEASEVWLGELSLDVQDAERREQNALKEVKEKTEQLAEKATEHSSRVQALEGQLQEESHEHSSRVKALETRLCELQEDNLSQASEYGSRVQALEAQLQDEKLQAASQATEHSSLVQVLESHVSQLQEENLSLAAEHSSRVQALEAQLQEEKLQAASQGTEHSARAQALEAQLQEEKSQAASQATEHSARVQALEAQLQEEKSQAASQVTEHTAGVQALEAQLQEEKSQAASQVTEHTARVQALEAQLQEEKSQAASQVTEHTARVQALEAQLQEEKSQAASQATEHSARVQALEAQFSELQGEISQAKASIAESRLWAQEAATLLREHVLSLREVGEGGRAEEDDEKGALQAEVEELHLKFVDMQLCDGTEALEMCKKLSSFEKERLKSQMLDAAQKISKLEGELEVLKAQIHALENPQEVKRSFREVILEGEVQSLRVQLKEFKAQVSEIPSLQAQLAQLQLNLRAAEKREHEQNLALVKVQREVCAAEEKVCSLKDALLNQTEVNALKEKVCRLEQNLMISEERNTSLKEEIGCHVKSNKETTTIVASDKVTDEVALEQASVSQKQIFQEIALEEASGSQKHVIQAPLKLKGRKRKNKKYGKAPVPLNTSAADGLTHSFRHRTIAVFLVSVLLVALVIRVSLR